MEGKGSGTDLGTDLVTINEGESSTRPVEPEEKYNHLLYLCLNKSDGQVKQLIVETLKSIGGEGEVIQGDDGEDYRAWNNMSEQDFGNVLFNVVMNLGIIYNKVCAGKEEDTIGELFKVEQEKV